MCSSCIITSLLEAARILAIISIPSYSHQIGYQPLWTALSRRGHKVVVLTTNPVNEPNITNLTEVDFHYNYRLLKDLNHVKMMEHDTWINVERNFLFNIGNELTEDIYKHPEVRKMYAPDSDQKFDAVIIEVIKTPGLYALAHRFNAPLIGISSVGLYSHIYYLLGAPVLPSHPSNWEMKEVTGFNLSLWQRLKNVIEQWYHIYCVLNHFFPQQQAIAEKYLGKNIPNIVDMERNISIIFHHQQEALSFIRPKTPNVIVFGNELTEDIYKHPEVRKMYAPDSDQKFDAVIEVFKTPGLYALAHRFNAPLIVIFIIFLVVLSSWCFLVPVLPSHPSNWEMKEVTGFNLSLWQRLKNVIEQWYHIYCVLNHFFPQQQAIAEKYLGKNIPNIVDMERNISIIFHHQQEALSFIRPKTPNVIVFGNSHVSKNTPTLPKPRKLAVGSQRASLRRDESNGAPIRNVLTSNKTVTYYCLWFLEVPSSPTRTYRLYRSSTQTPLCNYYYLF
ncbi:Ecdysteroid UDP-glucosyltransferase [Camponotus floridanus]|uniref:Ecdysteroid UDP-glucosyltransferase n=1 Tax=Camponotus floridanus TaxID=104421 RepID=E1ZYR3_CAMFO|nr:Ecdysteroid UDP-glucosyltransferase [Camponotus floridanus]